MLFFKTLKVPRTICVSKHAAGAGQTHNQRSYSEAANRTERAADYKLQ